MKLRLGSIQNEIDKAAEREKALSTIPTFTPTSLSFSGASYREVETLAWYAAPAGYSRESYSQLDMVVPFAQETYGLIMKLMWAGGRSNMIIRKAGEAVYQLNGAYICEVDHVAVNGFDEFHVSIRYDHMLVNI